MRLLSIGLSRNYPQTPFLVPLTWEYRVFHPYPSLGCFTIPNLSFLSFNHCLTNSLNLPSSSVFIFTIWQVQISWYLRHVSHTERSILASLSLYLLWVFALCIPDTGSSFSGRDTLHSIQQPGSLESPSPHQMQPFACWVPHCPSVLSFKFAFLTTGSRSSSPVPVCLQRIVTIWSLFITVVSSYISVTLLINICLSYKTINSMRAGLVLLSLTISFPILSKRH